jgi:hypothetical protein
MSFSFLEPGTALFPPSPSHAGADWQQPAARKLAPVACLPAHSEERTRTDSQPNAAGGGSQTRSVGLGLVSSSTSGTLQDEPILVDPFQNRIKRMRCRVLTGARLQVGQVPMSRVAMLTLTYRSGVEWEGRHVSDWIRLIRQWLKRRGVAYRCVWVAEIQEFRKLRQPEFHCVHYHLLVWLPRGVKLPMLDVRGWWPHGSTKMEWARDAVGYIAKYVSKGGESYRLPKGARMYGVGGLVGEALDEARWWARPSWLRELVKIGQKVFRNKGGGGWIDRDTGETYHSPWRVMFRAGAVYLYRITEAELQRIAFIRNAVARAASHALVTSGLALGDGYAQ